MQIFFIKIVAKEHICNHTWFKGYDWTRTMYRVHGPAIIPLSQDFLSYISNVARYERLAKHFVLSEHSPQTFRWCIS